jgi:hypothetical protein
MVKVSSPGIFFFWKQVYYNLIHNIFNCENMMHTNNIITLLKAQETALNVKIREMNKEKSSDELGATKVFAMSLRGNILKSVCVALWMMHLLKTSILVTKTPLTTLKCMPRAILKQTSHQKQNRAVCLRSENQEAELRQRELFFRRLFC